MIDKSGNTMSIYALPRCPLSADQPFQMTELHIRALPGNRIFPHWHDDFELIYIISGKMEFDLRQKAYLISAGEGLFLNSGELHFIHAYQSYDCRFVIFRISPMLFAQTNQSPIYKNYIHPIVSNPSFGFLPLVPKVPWQKYILETMKKMVQLCDKKSFGYEIKVQHFIHEIFYYIFQNIPAQKELTQRELRDLKRIKDVLSYLHETLQEKHRLSDIADFCHLSNSECCRLFQRNLRLSPMEYLNQHRIYESLPEILKHELSMGAIAKEVGFSGSSYFSEMFKKTLGITPRTFYKTFS